MIQNSRVLTTEANPISFISAMQATTPADYLAVPQRAIPTNKQTWIFEVAEMAPVSTETVERANPLLRIANWFNRLGSVRINETYLQSRQNVHVNPRINGAGF